jgi:hypothetical protein
MENKETPVWKLTWKHEATGRGYVHAMPWAEFEPYDCHGHYEDAAEYACGRVVDGMGTTEYASREAWEANWRNWEEERAAMDELIRLNNEETARLADEQAEQFIALYNLDKVGADHIRGLYEALFHSRRPKPTVSPWGMIADRDPAPEAFLRRYSQ